MNGWIGKQHISSILFHINTIITIMMYSTFPSVIFVANIYNFFSFVNILNQFFSASILYIFDNLVLFLSFQFLFFN